MNILRPQPSQFGGPLDLPQTPFSRGAERPRKDVLFELNSLRNLFSVRGPFDGIDRCESSPKSAEPT